MLPELRIVHGSTQVVLAAHALAIACGVAAGALLAVRRAADPALALLGVVLVAIGALLGAHGLFAALHGGQRGGLASTGGIATGLALAWLVARVARRPATDLLDVLVPAGLLALAIGRIGCFLAGCCYGRPTALPWGIVFPELGPPARHPLQLYSAAGDLALLVRLPWRSGVPGAVAGAACTRFGLLRTALELLRDPGTTDVLVRGWLTLPQAAALSLAGAAFVATRLRHHVPSTMAPARRKRAHGR